MFAIRLTRAYFQTGEKSTKTPTRRAKIETTRRTRVAILSPSLLKALMAAGMKRPIEIRERRMGKTNE
jgi:hypothetical protein